jgi:hypothetical protein
VPVDVKRLSRTVLLIRGSTIVKSEQPAGSIGRSLYRWVAGGSLPFQNEMHCYQANSEVFHDIEVIEAAKVILIRYEEPTGTVTPADISFDLVSRLHAVIGALRTHGRFSLAKRILFWLLNGPVPRSLRDLKRSQEFSLGGKLRLAAWLLKLEARQTCPSDKRRLIHNDLMLHNVLRFGNDYDYRLIDFEDSMLERKWIFADVTDLMFQAENWSHDEIVETLHRLADTCGVSRTETNFRDHFSYGFLRYHIRSTVMSRRSSVEKTEAAQCIKDWLNGS